MTAIKLRDKAVFPSDEVLQNTLGESFVAFRSLNDVLSSHAITPEWSYYKDGKAWLCKMLFKKKTLGWISVCDGYFNITCYFTQKHLEKIERSAISQSTKECFYSAKPCGKLIPMAIPVYHDPLPEDVSVMLLVKMHVSHRK